jgi:multiple sugar transport system substrate-binding protein
MRELEGANGKANTGLARAASYDGQWWGVPYYERAGGWYVRNDWCKEVGVDPTRDLETIQGARDAAMKLSNPEKHRWGWGMTVNRSGDGETTVRTIGYAHGARIQDKDGLRVTIDTPAWAAAMEFLKETYSDPKWAKMLPPGIASWNDISNNEAFLAGTIGLTDNAGTMLAKAYFDKGPFAGDIGFVKRPRSDLGRGPVPQSGGGETIRFFKGSKNKDAAFDTIRHWLSPDAQRTIWTISPAYALPAYTNGWDDPLVRGNAVSTAYREIAFNEGWDSDYTPGPRTAAMGALLGGTFFTDMATDALRATKTTKQVVEDAHRRAVKVFQQFGLAGE